MLRPPVLFHFGYHNLKWYRNKGDSIPRLNAHLDGAAMAVVIGHGDTDEAGAVGAPEAVGGEGRRHQRPAIDHPEERGAPALRLEGDAALRIRLRAPVDERAVGRKENMRRLAAALPAGARRLLARDTAQNRRQGGVAGDGEGLVGRLAGLRVLLR